jgi:tRNA uridine 5-carboxymethylaminomethyl modification enzyme
LGDAITLSQLSQRQGVNSDLIFRLLPQNIRSEVSLRELETTLADSLYSGYIENQRSVTERIYHNDNLRVPTMFSYQNLSGLSQEMAERLDRAKPNTFGQLRRISGMTPSAISTVLVHLTAHKN